MTFEEEKRAFFEMLGQAINEWVAIETSLFFVFMGCLSSPRQEIARALFYSVDAFSSKLNMTDKVMKIALDLPGSAEFSLEWVKLEKRARDLSKSRNAIAHHTIFFDETRRIGQRVLLVESLLSPKFSYELIRDKRSQGIGTKEIKEKIESFRLLANDIRYFCHRFGQGHPHFVRSLGWTSTKGDLDYWDGDERVFG